MKNLNEPRKDQDVIPFEQRRSATPKEATGSLIPARQLDELRARWTTIQSSFVDEPRRAVEEADKLVASAVKQIEDLFAAERANLEKQWSRGDEVSTEDLRVALKHYRDFFDRVLTRI
jgi:hypothetical protein